MKFLQGILSFIKSFSSLFSWLSTSLKQTTASYVELQTADSDTCLVSNDGSLVSVIRIDGVTELIGTDEFASIQNSLQQSLQSVMAQPGHIMQVFFSYSGDSVAEDLNFALTPAQETAERLQLDLSDLFAEKINHLQKYCSSEEVYIVLWTTPKSLTSEQARRASKQNRNDNIRDNVPGFLHTQNIIAAIPQLREGHDSFAKTFVQDLKRMHILSEMLDVHSACQVIRMMVDPDFTSVDWKPSLPGDKITIKEPEEIRDISDITWPSLSRQLVPRDGFVHDLRTAQLGDRIYATIFIDLFPKDVQMFSRLLGRTINSNMPWRMSFLIESDGLAAQGMRQMMSSILAFTSKQNRLINDSLALLSYININTDDSVVRLRVALSTWANEGQDDLLRIRVSMLSKAVEGWGSCDVSEMSGDPFAGLMSTQLAITSKSIATSALAPLSDVLTMLPLFRPASIWKQGAVMLRSPDGKLWPYHPGSRQQTTWIDLFYARPGSGKSVLSNAINLAVCLSSGLKRLPRIAVIDIGPSSSGLVSLLKDALPESKKHQVAHHRLRMTAEHSINPFDTQLGSRYPTAQDRSFLVNLLSLLATPVGSEKSYDGVSDMSGMIIDELYKQYSEDGKSNSYAFGIEPIVDGILEEIAYVADSHTSWWEIADALFMSGFTHQANFAQRRAMPVLADVAAVCRLPAIEDLYGKIVAPTGEPLLHAFSRMISAAVREYPIISQVTQFDLGDARVVALDLDEVARSGGDAANRQTAVMYMLARFMLARDFYLTEDNVAEMPEGYRKHHLKRITELGEDQKRIVFDEFHRTSHSEAVRNQVVQDMREGRKWKVQVALLSQSLSDFDSVMVEFATSVFIMDAGPEQAIKKTTEVFGLSDTAKSALRNSVHGPGPAGATFLAQFATKGGTNTQLLTSTLGPVELWALTTTREDSVIRNQLYKRIGPKETRKLLARLYPSGTAMKDLEERYANYKEQSGGLIDDDSQSGVMNDLIAELVHLSQNK
jgi:intracellular multiplication protein IcmB